MSEYNNSKLHNVIRKWNTQQLIETLKDNGLDECCDVIRDKQIDGDAFMNLTEGQLVLWKNKLTKLQITRLWWVIQLAHGIPEDFIRSKQPSIHKKNSNILAKANSIQNKLEKSRLQAEPKELYSNHEAARSEIPSKPKKPLPVLKPAFITKPNPVLPNYNKKVQGNQNKELSTPAISTLDHTYLPMDKSILSMDTLPTAYPIRHNDTVQSAFEATLSPSISAQKLPTLGKSPLQTPSPQLPSGKTALQIPSQNLTNELKAKFSPSRYQKSPPLHKAPLQTPSPQLPSGKSALAIPPQILKNELISPQDFQKDKNQSILHQMINKSPILRRISPHNNVFSTNEEISQEIPENRQPTKPPSSSYSWQPPSNGDPIPFRQIPVPPMQLPGPPIQLPGPPIQLPGPPIQLPGPPMQLPGPPMGSVPDIKLDDFDDDFDEGYEYIVILDSLDYKSKPWFKDVNRNAAEKLLIGKPNGAFIVRPSKHEKHECTFSINYNNHIFHVAIHKCDSAFTLGNASYNTITEIVDKYMEENLILNGKNNENCYVKLQFIGF